MFSNELELVSVVSNAARGEIKRSLSDRGVGAGIYNMRASIYRCGHLFIDAGASTYAGIYLSMPAHLFIDAVIYLQMPVHLFIDAAIYL